MQKVLALNPDPGILTELSNQKENKYEIRTTASTRQKDRRKNQQGLGHSLSEQVTSCARPMLLNN
jgi:hypothetical protein